MEGPESHEALYSQSNVHHNSLSTDVYDKIWPERPTNHTQNPFVPIFTHPTFASKSSLELSVKFGFLIAQRIDILCESCSGKWK